MTLNGFDDVEIATAAEWIDWSNHRRPFEYCDDLPPVEAEQRHYRHHQTPTTAAVSSRTVSRLTGAGQLKPTPPSRAFATDPALDGLAPGDASMSAPTAQPARASRH